MTSNWSKNELRELRHHLRLLWISFDPAEAPKDDAYDAYVDELLQLCIDKRALNEVTGFVDWVVYKKFNLRRSVDSDEANAHFAKKVLAWYRDCELLVWPEGEGDSSRITGTL